MLLFRKPVAIHYGSGSVSGFLSQDNAKVGDLVIKDQVFIKAITEGSFTFVLANFDGIFGLGFQDILVGNVVPPWYNIVDQGLVDEEVFSFWLNQNPDTEEGGYCEGGCATIGDSGTSLLGGPTNVVNQINHAIGAEGLVSADLLGSWLEPEVLCSKIGLCHSNEGHQHASSKIRTVVEKENQWEKSSDNSLFCDACELVVGWVQSQLKQEGMKEEVLNYVNQLCDSLPSPI